MRNLTVLGAVLAVTVGLTFGARAQDVEKCYGVARAGTNDGVGSNDAPRSSTINFQGNAWMWVEQGKCQTISLPPQADGTPRRGSLEPLDRDAP